MTKLPEEASSSGRGGGENGGEVPLVLLRRLKRNLEKGRKPPPRCNESATESRDFKFLFVAGMGKDISGTWRRLMAISVELETEEELESRRRSVQRLIVEFGEEGD
ncbi:hypothetical protein Q3G72_012540 [Acer saccharum]|nr:hypothetical protein Q3G72_012540 [Acer saccharum]